MKPIRYAILFILLIFATSAFAQTQYPFQNPNLPIEERISNIISLMTLDEKIACLGTRPNVPRLGIRGAGHVEGLHGLAQGGPSNWGRINPCPTTIFPQAIGMAETWDTDVMQQAGGIEGYEVRYMFQSKYNRGGLVVRAPNADLGATRDGEGLKSAMAKIRSSTAPCPLHSSGDCRATTRNTG